MFIRNFYDRNEPSQLYKFANKDGKLVVQEVFDDVRKSVKEITKDLTEPSSI